MSIEQEFRVITTTHKIKYFTRKELEAFAINQYTSNIELIDCCKESQKIQHEMIELYDSSKQINNESYENLKNSTIKLVEQHSKQSKKLMLKFTTFYQIIATIGVIVSYYVGLNQ